MKKRCKKIKMYKVCWKLEGGNYDFNYGWHLTIVRFLKLQRFLRSSESGLFLFQFQLFVYFLFKDFLLEYFWMNEMHCSKVILVHAQVQAREKCHSVLWMSHRIEKIKQRNRGGLYDHFFKSSNKILLSMPINWHIHVEKSFSV